MVRTKLHMATNKNCRDKLIVYGCLKNIMVTSAFELDTLFESGKRTDVAILNSRLTFLCSIKRSVVCK